MKNSYESQYSRLKLVCFYFILFYANVYYRIIYKNYTGDTKSIIIKAVILPVMHIYDSVYRHYTVLYMLAH